MTEKDKEIQELRIEVDRLKKELAEVRRAKQMSILTKATAAFYSSNNVYARYDTPEDEIARLRACLSLIATITARAAE